MTGLKKGGKGEEERVVN